MFSWSFFFFSVSTGFSHKCFHISSVVCFCYMERLKLKNIVQHIFYNFVHNAYNYFIHMWFNLYNIPSSRQFPLIFELPRGSVYMLKFMIPRRTASFSRHLYICEPTIHIKTSAPDLSFQRHYHVSGEISFVHLAHAPPCWHEPKRESLFWKQWHKLKTSCNSTCHASHDT